MTDQERNVEEPKDLQNDVLQSSGVVAVEETTTPAVEQHDAVTSSDVETAATPTEKATHTPAVEIETEVPAETTAAIDASIAEMPAESTEAPAGAEDAAIETPAAEPVMSAAAAVETPVTDDTPAETPVTDDTPAVVEDAVTETPTTEAPTEAETPAGAEDAATETPAAEPMMSAAAAVETPVTDDTPAEAPAKVEDAATETPAAEAPTEAETPAGAEDAAAIEAPAPERETSTAPIVETTAEAEGAAAEGEASFVAETPHAETTAEAEGTATEGEASFVADDGASSRPRRVKDLAPGMELEGKVTSIALYGIFVDIGVGRDGLVHVSEMSDTRVESPSDVVKIGDKVMVRVKSIEPDGRRISLTMRTKERQAQPRGQGGRSKKSEVNRDRLGDLRVGENVEGKITGMAGFGVFVDIGVGKDGLVHVSELAEGRVEKAEDVVQVGQTYTFKVLEVDADGSRISLSLRRAQRSQRMQQLEKGQILDGTVSGIATFGAFVDVGVGRDGLVHISELTDGRVGKVEDAVKVGDKIKVRVLDVDTQSKRISLSLRLDDSQDEDLPARGDAPAAPARRYNEERFQRPARDDRQQRNRPAREERQPEVYSSTPDPDETFTGDATLEDLMSKYGRNNNERRQRDEESDEQALSGRQREAQRRTLQSLGDEE